MTLLNGLLILIALILLTVGAECLVRGAATLSRRLGLSTLFIGLTIVGFGTSTPELFASLSAAAHGSGDIAIGNCIGSNIFNIAVILGVTALICPIPIRVSVVRSEVILVIAAALLPLLAALTGNMMLRWEGALFLLFLAVYIWRGAVLGRREAPEVADAVNREIAAVTTITKRPWSDRLPVQITLIAIGLALLVVGSNVLVHHAVGLARALGVPELAIGLTLVAGGTSVPELATSVMAALRKQPDIAVGNVLGSNIFNIAGILGVTALVEPQRITPQTLLLDTPVMLAASIACLPIMLSQRRIDRLEGAALVLGYGVYLAILFIAAPRWFGP